LRGKNRSLRRSWRKQRENGIATKEWCLNQKECVLNLRNINQVKSVEDKKATKE